MITATAKLTETISVTASLSVCLPATYTLIDTDVPPNTLGSGSIAAGAAATIVAPAASVTVNTTPFGTAPSGGALDVPVVNGGANPVGSEQAGEWVIGNSTVTINGTQVGDIEAEDSLPIAVELDGNPSGVWNAGTQTWEVKGPVIAVRSAYAPNTFTVWVGWGSVGTTDQTPITIKRGITDPITGLVTETEAFGPWDDYLTLPYS